MKKILSLLSLLLIAVVMFSGCGQQPVEKQDDVVTDDPNEDVINVVVDETPDVTEATDYVTEKWVAAEIPFTATNEIKNIQDAEVDVTFVNRTTGTKMVMPAFWDGGTDWKVRFAPTECGIWDYTLAFTGADLGITAAGGTLACNTYKGDLDIYKHGFVNAYGNKYFSYADGTPFFYLGDTHWGMLGEEFDSAGPNAGDIQTDSHFKYIVDKRIEQGFTVYQSEPIGHGFVATDGITKTDMRGFQKCDQYFQYIAEKGMVHANAELLFPGEVTDKFIEDTELIRAASRYWVARYGAYPVMWTLGQEIDNDYFGKNNITTENNPYVVMAKYIAECDPYKSPLTGHQENTSLVGAKGGVPSIRAGKACINEPSVFLGNSAHTWWGVQWHPAMDQQYNFLLVKDFWENGEGKPAVLYETLYECLDTNNYGARAKSWIAYLSGLYGCGYGCQDIWYYKSEYGKNSESRDGNITVTLEDKQITWGEAIKLPTGDQLGYMRQFFEKLAWWKLVPDFEGVNAYQSNKENNSALYAVAYNKDKVYVAYFYNENEDAAGTLINMNQKATYTAQWFNPVTNEYTLIDNAIKPEKIGETYGYNIPNKPTAQDMVLIVTKN